MEILHVTFLETHRNFINIKSKEKEKYLPKSNDIYQNQIFYIYIKYHLWIIVRHFYHSNFKI